MGIKKITGMCVNNEIRNLYGPQNHYNTHTGRRGKLRLELHNKELAIEVAGMLYCMTGDDVRLRGEKGHWKIERWTGSMWVKG
jgi:hypothetical protein